MDAKVLEKDRAILWLKRSAKELIRQFDFNTYDPQDVADIIQDILEDIKIIERQAWKYVLIEECPMATSGINVIKYNVLGGTI